MKNNALFFLFIFGFFGGYGIYPCFADEETMTAKRNLVSYIEREIQQINEALEQPFKSAVWTSDSAQAKRIERDIKGNLSDERKNLKKMLRVVKNHNDETLAFLFVEHLIDGNLSWKGYSNNLGQYIQVLGETAIPAIDKNFERSSSFIKSHLLAILGAIPSRKSIQTIKRALKDDDKNVVLSAFSAWYRILGLKINPNFAEIFVKEKGTFDIENDPNTLYLAGEKEWYGALLNYSQSNNIRLYDLAMIVNFDSFPGSVVGKYSGYLIGITQATGGNISEQRLAVQLLLRIEDKEQLRGLSPLLKDLLTARFYVGGINESYSVSPVATSDSLFVGDDAVILSERILSALTLDDINNLLVEHSSNQFLRIFLREQLNKKSNAQETDQEKTFHFRVEVADQTGNVVSSAAHILNLGKEQKLVLPAGVNGFPAIC